MSTVATLVVALQGNIRGFTRSLDLAEARLSRFGTGAGAKGAFVGLTVSALAAGAVVTAMSAKIALDFESAMAGVRKTVDATDAEFAELTQGIRDMAKALPVGTTEIAKVAEIAGQLGVKVGDIQEFTRVMIDLGVSTNLSASDASTGLARFSNVMQTPISMARELGDVIVTLGNNFATTESEILGMAQRITGLAVTLGLSERDVLGLSAGLTALGVPSELGGTAIQRFGLIVKQAVGEAGEDLDRLAAVAGVSAEEFAKQFGEDPVNALLAFTRGLAQAEERGVDQIQILKSVGLANQRQIRVLLAMTAGYKQMDAAIALANDELQTSGALATEAQRRFDTGMSRIKVAINNVKDAFLTFGQSIIAGALPAMDAVGAWFAKNGPALSGFFETISPAISAFGVVLMLAFTGLGAVLGVLAQFKLLIPLIIAGFIALTVALFPIIGTVAIFVAVGIAIAAFVGLLAKNMDKVKAVIRAVVQFIDDHWKIAAVILFALLGPIGLVIVGLVKFRDRIRDIFVKVVDVFRDLKDNWRSIVVSMIQLAENLANGVARAMEGFVNAIVGAVNKVKNLGPGLPGFDVGDIPEVKFGTFDFSGLTNFVETVGTGIRSVGEQVSTAVGLVEEEMGDFSGTATGKLLPSLEGVNFAAAGAAAQLTDLERAIKRFKEQRLEDEFAAFVRGGSKAVLALRRKNAQLDAEFEKTLAAAQKFGMDVTLLHRGVFDRVIRENEQGTQRIEGLLAFLVARRLGMGLDPGGGLVQFTPGALADASAQSGDSITIEQQIVLSPDIVPGTVDTDAAAKLGGEGARKASAGLGLEGRLAI